jgi:hypothetical protein
MADESAYSLEKVLEIVSKQAVDCVNIKLEKCGGITPAVQISSICSAGGIPCQLGDAVTGGLNTAAGIHFACSNANVQYFEFGCGPFMRVRDFTDVVDDKLLNVFKDCPYKGKREDCTFPEMHEMEIDDRLDFLDKMDEEEKVTRWQRHLECLMNALAK